MPKFQFAGIPERSMSVAATNPISTQQPILTLPDLHIDTAEPVIDMTSQNEKLLQDARMTLVPEVSLGAYFKRYQQFMNFRMERSLGGLPTEDHALMWLQSMKATYMGSSLYSMWSGVKSLLVNKDNVNADNWGRVNTWLKRQRAATKDQETSAKSFTMEELNDFRSHADPTVYERQLLALSMGICGRLDCK